MLRKTYMIAILFACSIPLAGQTNHAWTLEECIRYAVENNIDVQKQTIAVDESELSLIEGKWAFVPTLSASASYTIASGRVLDQTTYQFVETDYTTSSTASISGDLSLFEGGRKIYALNKAKLSLKAANLKEESVKYNLRLNVIASYMDVLCAEEQVVVAEESANLVEAQLERAKVLLEAGSITESDVLQLQSQLFAANNDIALANHSEKMARLALCNLLEIEDYESFVIAKPENSVLLPPVIDVDSVVENNPDYQASIMNIGLFEYDYKIAKAGYSPRLSLSLGYGSSFSSARKKQLLNEDLTMRYEAYPFLEQYTDNASVFVSVGIAIPILNGLTVRNNVKRAKLAARDAELNMRTVKKNLHRQILQAQIDCETAQGNYYRTEEEVKYAEEAMRQVSEKYRLGTTDYLSWNTAMIELSKARYNLIEAKYTYLLKYEMLKSY